MRLIDADKLFPDVMKVDGSVAISQGQLAYAPTVEAIPKDQINKAIEKIEQYICDVETDTVKAQGMAQALDIFEQALKGGKE